MSNQRQSPARPAAGSDARLALILVAERNLALFGLDGVSINAIVKEAGQRNMSAVHYHFGDRAAMVQDILNFRQTSIEEARRRLYEATVEGAGDPDLRVLVDIAVNPLADLMLEMADPSFYLRFLEQVTNHESYRHILDARAPVARTFSRLLDDIRRLLHPMPAAIVEARLDDFAEHMVSSLARVETLIGKGTRITPALRVANLIDQLIAGLTAPLSPATRRRLDEAAG